MLLCSVRLLHYTIILLRKRTSLRLAKAKLLELLQRTMMDGLKESLVTDMAYFLAIM